MACLVSANFSSLQTLPTAFVSSKELCPKVPACFVISSLRFNTATIKVISSACTTNQSQGLSHHITRDLSALDVLLSDASHCPRMLTGHWVGPDIEDGWGFVKAFVGEIL